MSIAPIGPDMGFGVTPGFGINPAYGVSATPPRTEVDTSAVPATGAVSFAQALAQQIGALDSATGARGVGAAAPVVADNPFGRVGPYGDVTTGATGTRPVAVQGDVNGIGEMIAGKIGQLESLHKRTDALAVAAVTGDLKDIHEYTIAANESGVATQLAVSVRDKAVAAFNDVIRMQL